jgi:hypothetical protein
LTTTFRRETSPDDGTDGGANLTNTDGGANLTNTDGRKGRHTG